MLEDENYKIVKMHICSFERINGVLVFDKNKYPERLCVCDKKNKIVVDVETLHRYPYVRILNQQEIYYKEDVKFLTPNMRVGCMEYVTFLSDISEDQLKQIQSIIRLLNGGYNFENGNLVLSNEQYLKMINNPKNKQKSKKITETYRQSVEIRTRCY